MRKYICAGLILVAGLAIAIAGNVEEVTSRQGFTTLYEVKDSVNALATGGTLTNGLDVTGTVAATAVTSTGEVTADGKYVTVGPDATTGLMIQVGSCTNGETITFSPVFGATPRVVGNHSVDAGADAVIEFTSTTPTNTTVAATSAKTIDYIAIGTRP